MFSMMMTVKVIGNQDIKLIREKERNLQKGNVIYNQGDHKLYDDETQMSNEKDTRSREGHVSQHMWEIQAFRNSW